MAALDSNEDFLFLNFFAPIAPNLARLLHSLKSRNMLEILNFSPSMLDKPRAEDVNTHTIFIGGIFGLATAGYENHLNPYGFEQAGTGQRSPGAGPFRLMPAKFQPLASAKGGRNKRRYVRFGPALKS